jgi:hypothetical protein
MDNLTSPDTGPRLRTPNGRALLVMRADGDRASRSTGCAASPGRRVRLGDELIGVIVGDVHLVVNAAVLDT